MFAYLESHFGLGGALVAIHIIPFVIAFLVWLKKSYTQSSAAKIMDIIGIISLPVFVLVLLFVSEDKHPGGSAGHAAGWFFIFSLLSFGLLPIFTLLTSFFSGRFAGRLLRSWLK